MSYDALIDELARLCGVQRSYHDIWGNVREATRETELAFLRAMGVDLDGEETLRRAISERTEGRWIRVLPKVQVARQQHGRARLALTVREEHASRPWIWRCVEEGGREHSGRVVPQELGEPERRHVRGASFARFQWTPPLDLPLGYHHVEVRLDEEHAPVERCTLIVAPAKCWVPPALREGERLWGPAVQLYALRSARDFGVGDFSDLLQLVSGLGRMGAGFVGVNPLHALFPHNPAHKSPYSPSSRLFLNVLYIDVEAEPDFEECAEARALVSQPEFRERWRAMREARLVDYPGAMALKRPVLELMYRHFREQHLRLADDERAQEFRAFLADGGEALEAHARFEALQEHFHAADASVWGWPVWPEAYRDPRSPEVARFAETHRDRVELFAYLQWLAEQQLARAAEVARAVGMPLGLYVDLAVGVDGAGSEAWGWKDLYATGVSVGAPPDDFALQGQNWGLPPLIPERLVETAYAPFIETLRLNMRRAGALRIDHVMALMRLFWIPPGGKAAEGAYISYPFDDLLAILALESQRHECLVIGEDLGTVPGEVRAALAEHEVLSYRVFLFENDERGEPKAPDAFPRCALVTFSTHDLPTLAGFWKGRDLALRDELGLFPSHEMRERLHDWRNHQRWAFLRALQREGLAPDPARLDPAQWPEVAPELMRAIHAYVARTPSWLMAVQLEDVLGVTEQANLPSTVDEHPNWQRKLPLTVEEILASDAFQRLVAVLGRERAGMWTSG